MDIAFKQIGDFQFDFLQTGANLSTDADLETAVIISLFTDRRAEDDDRLPDETESLRGWWGDALNPRRIGSRLWLLRREKQILEVLLRAKEYTEEALEWLRQEKIARSVVVNTSVVATGILGISIQIMKPDGKRINMFYEWAWQQTRG